MDGNDVMVLVSQGQYASINVAPGEGHPIPVPEINMTPRDHRLADALAEIARLTGRPLRRFAASSSRVGQLA